MKQENTEKTVDFVFIHEYMLNKKNKFMWYLRNEKTAIAEDIFSISLLSIYKTYKEIKIEVGKADSIIYTTIKNNRINFHRSNKKTFDIEEHENMVYNLDHMFNEEFIKITEDLSFNNNELSEIDKIEKITRFFILLILRNSLHLSEECLSYVLDEIRKSSVLREAIIKTVFYNRDSNKKQSNKEPIPMTSKEKKALFLLRKKINGNQETTTINTEQNNEHKNDDDAYDDS